MTGTTDLARRFGTPSYVYDLDRVAAARDDLFAALPDEVAVYYAAKANPHPEILREMRAGGPVSAVRRSAPSGNSTPSCGPDSQGPRSCTPAPARPPRNWPRP